MQMRGYIGSTAHEIEEFLSAGSIKIESLYASTANFRADHGTLDDEEQEFILSMLAAEDSLEDRKSQTDSGFVLAFEIDENNISGGDGFFIDISQPIVWSELQCAFLVSSDGEELTWFAPQEIQSNLAQWLLG